MSKTITSAVIVRNDRGYTLSMRFEDPKLDRDMSVSSRNAAHWLFEKVMRSLD